MLDDARAPARAGARGRAGWDAGGMPPSRHARPRAAGDGRGRDSRRGLSARTSLSYREVKKQQLTCRLSCLSADGWSQSSQCSRPRPGDCTFT